MKTGAETQNGLVPHAHVLDKNWEAYLVAKVPPEEPGPSPTPGSTTQVQVPGREVSITSGCESQWKLAE